MTEAQAQSTLSREGRRQLEFSGAHSNSWGLSVISCKPDFIGIGAQKAATNWLWHNLKQHPAVWMPPIKELHFFDRSPRYPSPSYLSSEHFLDRVFGRDRYDKEFREVFTRMLGAAFLKSDWMTFRWHARHYFGRCNAQWYLSLFAEGTGQLRGEITPSYSILDLADVRNIKRILPALKVILILRNPIDRAWSHIRFDWERIENIDNPESIKAFIDSPKQHLRGDYIRTIGIWSSCFPAEQFFIGFYDDVAEQPGRILSDVHKFLGIPSDAPESDGPLDEKIFASKQKQIPDDILRYLTEKYQPEIERLSEMLGGHTKTWLVEANGFLNRDINA